MPGRLVLYDDTNFKRDVLHSLGTFQNKIENLTPHYNIPPTKPLATLLNNGSYEYTHFGLIPHWAKDKKAMQINARSENLFERVSFTESFRRRRSLIPLNGWYEWEEHGTIKRPFFIYPKEKTYFALAGVWDQWIDPLIQEKITSTALITVNACNTIKTIHHRMPVILAQKDWRLWMDPDANLQEVYQLLVPYPDDQGIMMHRVSEQINSVGFDRVEAIEVCDDLPKGQGDLFTSFK